MAMFISRWFADLLRITDIKITVNVIIFASAKLILLLHFLIIVSKEPG
jgi:hypothetical protein